MKNLGKTIKDDVVQLRREVAKAKREWNAKNKRLELQVKSQEEDIRKKKAEIKKLRTQLKEKTMTLSQLKKGSASKIKELKSKVGEIEKPQQKYREPHVPKDLLDRREAELHQLKVEVEYKNKLSASKDLEMESYKKVAEQTIFRLDARVKELEAKALKSSRNR